MRPVSVIDVRIWGKKVGSVALDPRYDYYSFKYDPKFVTTGIELAPLTMPLAKAHAPFFFPNLPELTFHRLPALLADALPDDFGNNLIDAWMLRKGISKSAISALDRLAYMGKRAMGALEFHPARGPAKASYTAIKLSNLVEDARQVVQGHFDSDSHALAALSHIIRVGTSAGGARAKAVIAWNPKTKEIRAGQFDVEPGFEHWLLKFDGVAGNTLGDSQDYGRIEYAYHLMARQAGITQSPCALLHENGRTHFMTRRFDRENSAKYHIQTLCAMSHMDYKQTSSFGYDQLFATLDELGLSHTDVEEAFRRMVFNVLSANCDDHTKNFSFLLREGGIWELAPAYDLTHAYNPDSPWVCRQFMSVNGKFADIRKADFLVLADRFSVYAAPKIIEEVSKVVRAWPDFAKEAGVCDPESERIYRHHLERHISR